MSEELETYLEAAPGVQCQPREIFELARRIASGAPNDVTSAAKLFTWVRETVRYVPYVPFHRIEDYEALTVLERGRGYCVQKSALLTALCRAVGIPSRLGFADIRNHQLPEGMAEMMDTDIMAHHCFSELWLGGRWLKATPSFEAELCQRMGWHLVEFDGTADAMLPEKDIQGRPHITYIKHHGHRVGVPLDEILKAWRDCYGEERVARWMEKIDNGEERW